MAKAKGIPSLKDSVPDKDIIRLGEIRNEPNYIFSDDPEYGISGKYRDLSLVTSKLSYRTGTVDDGVNCGKVIEYTSWDDIPCFNDTFQGCFKSYAKIKFLTVFKTKKKLTEIKDVVKIWRDIQTSIDKSLQGFMFSQDSMEACSKMDTIAQLDDEIKKRKAQLDKYIKIEADIDAMHKIIKEKCTIIVDRDKKRVHKHKEEE